MYPEIKRPYNMTGRMTRLGEFLPKGRLFTLGIFIKITEVAQNCGLLFFFSLLDYTLILTKKVLATFWAIFSQTHLVTQLTGYT
jgi:hypothetical protein